MPRNIHDQIAANRRTSLFYCFLVIALLAALGGAVVGYYSPQNWIPGVVLSAGLGLIVALIAWSSGSKIVLQMNNARDATPHELQVVNNVAEEMAIAAGIPKPQVYVIDEDAPNAFATGGSPENGAVCVTTGLLDRLNREELQGVIAHEIGHIRNNDVRLMTTLAIVVGLIPMIAHFFTRSMYYGGGRRGRDRDGGAAIFMVIGLVLAIVAPLCAKLLELAVSRRREFMADASAAQFTRNPEALASALEKIAVQQAGNQSANKATEHMYIVNPFSPMQKAASLFSTHPPTEERVAALRGLAGMDYHRFLSMK